MLVMAVAQGEKSEVKDILGWLKDQSYTAEEAENVAGRLLAHKELWLAAHTLVTRGEHPHTLTVAGISYDVLRNQFHMTPTNALLTLAWLREEPAEAIEALRDGIR